MKKALFLIEWVDALWLEKHESHVISKSEKSAKSLLRKQQKIGKVHVKKVLSVYRVSLNHAQIL